MSVMGILISFFPLALISLFIGVCLAPIAVSPPSRMAAALCVVYLIPPLCFRLHHLIFGKPKPVSRITEPTYNSWWGGYQIQSIYVALPWLEALLRIIPGAYSAWLRLWGSQIGKRVFWTPTILITDRDMLIVGDDAVLGHRVEALCHVIKPKNGGMRLYLLPVTIGNSAFIGAGSHLAPGSVVDPGAFVPILTNIHPKKRHEDLHDSPAS